MGKKTNLKGCLVVAAILLWLWPAVSVGGIICVDADASPGGDGTTWGTAYKYLQDGLDNAVADDEIWVAEGTYNPDDDDANHPDGSGLWTDTFQLINGVAIYGGFAGGETSLDERDHQTNETILSGDLAGNDVGGLDDPSREENSYNVVTGSGTNATAVLDGFTITASYDSGMYNYLGSPTVTNCTFSGNSAYIGGGMYNGESSPTVTNCIFSGNIADANGGGMANCENSSPMVTNCTFIGNSSACSGGMYNYYYSSTTVTNCTFSGNSAVENGGGMFNHEYSSTTVRNCILWGNTAPSGPEISNDGSSSVSVEYSDVEVESGDWDGTGNINTDPLFADADLRLSGGRPPSATSPCIDAGDNMAIPPDTADLDNDEDTAEETPLDLDGNPRRVNDPFTPNTGNSGDRPRSGHIVDMGAYEYPPPPHFFVDGDANGANDGSSWENAFNHLQDALADAQVSGDDIWVAEGTYKPDANTANPGGTGERTATFQLINGVAIYGGFAGYWAADPNVRDIELYETILSGDVNTPGDSSDNSYHVVTGSGTDANAILDGFTITAGNANTGSDPHRNGGGMHNASGGSPTVTNCTFSGNSARYGGGMYNGFSSSPSVTNCTFSGNFVYHGGGGMFNWSSSSPAVSNCTFIGNSADYGGGMANYNYCHSTLTNCTFSGNTVIGEGGGMYNCFSNPTLVNCTLSGNSAEWGGGILNNNGDPTITNCILWGNTAPSGAQIYNAVSYPTVTYSDIAGGYGGTGNINADPLFIAPNGLDGIPNTADDEQGYVHLRCYSPCINAGDPAGDYSGQVDVDNQPRVAYGGVDMGTDEVFPIAGDYEPDEDVDFLDFAIFANHWLVGP